VKIQEIDALTDCLHTAGGRICFIHIYVIANIFSFDIFAIDLSSFYQIYVIRLCDQQWEKTSEMNR